MRKLFTLCLLIVSLSGISQWQQTGAKVRYVNGLGIPTRDTAAGVLADSSQILIRPQDSALYVKYKRTWLRVGGGGGSIAGSGTTNYIPKFTSSTAIGNSLMNDNGTGVAIGTTTQTSLLELHGATGIISKFNGTGTTNSYLDFQNAGTTRWRLGNNHLAGSNVWTLFNATSSTTAMIVNQSNQVVIGTGSALEKFNVTTATGVTGFMETVSSPVRGNLFYDTDGTGWKFNIGKLQSGTFTPQMTFQDTGNIGINQTAPAGRFVVADGQTLLGTNTNNGVDRLQVSGSVISSSTLKGGANGVNGLVVNSGGATGAILNNIATSGGAGFDQIRLTFQHLGADRAYWYYSNTGGQLVTSTALTTNDIVFAPGNSSALYMKAGTQNVVISNSGTDNSVDKLQVNGSIQGNGFDQAYLARTTTYTATTTDYFIDCTSGTFTVNLFTAVGNTGRILIIKNSGTGTITVDPNGSQTIDGATTQTLSTQWSRVHIISDGANWKIISN